jgi:hypothetical protein
MELYKIWYERYAVRDYGTGKVVRFKFLQSVTIMEDLRTCEVEAALQPINIVSTDCWLLLKGGLV